MINNTVLEVLITVIVFYAIVASSALIALYVLERKKIQNEDRDLGLLIECKYDIANDEAQLDAFINNCWTEYQVVELVKYQDIITDDVEIKILKELAEMVDSRISINLKKRLMLYWTKDGLDELIANKVYMLVMNYVATSRVPQ